MKDPMKESREVNAAITHGHLHQAIGRLRTLAPAGNWEIASALDSAEQDYRLMLQYAFAPTPDPDRHTLYGKITERLRGVLDRIVRESLAVDSSELYFGTLRYERTRRADSIASLLDSYRTVASQQSLFARAAGGTSSASQAGEADQLRRRIFNRIWVTFPLSAADCEALTTLWDDPTMPEAIKYVCVAALMLGAMEYYSEPALDLLLRCAMSVSEPLALRATMAALMVMGMNSHRSMSARITSRLESLRASTDWSQRVKLVWLQYVRSLDTEAISRRMRDELLPGMMELHRKLKDKLPDDPEALLDPEENPEWEESLRSSGLADKLRELSEMQNEGADLLHGTFSALKSFSFFNEISHWFLPFDPDSAEVTSQLSRDDRPLADVIAAMPMMCDSDKFSLVFSLASTPAAQKQMMMAGLQGHTSELARISASELLPGTGRQANTVRCIMQDLYRFYSLFRRKSEFTNPFAAGFNLPEVEALWPDMEGGDTLRAVAELYFRHGHYRYALTILDRLDPAKSDADTLQKIGYSHQKLGETDQAIAAYQKAELMAPENRWTRRRLAALYRQTGRSAMALEYYNRLSSELPDDASLALATGYCHLDMGHYREALHNFYKAEFMDEKSTKPLRPIAWVAMLMRDFDIAARYYGRLLQSVTPTPTDYLHMGHLSLLTGDARQAINYYKLYLNSRPAQELEQALRADEPQLREAGIDTSLIPLIIDSILYDNDR